MRSVLESQRPKHEANSDTAFMIDELLPQLSSPDRRSAAESGVSVSRDLSAVLKNLKKLEHSFDVLNLALDPNAPPPRRQSNAFFVVDV
ncbi:unnamed protein product [Oppiella nova]|uniref:Uncharacterized protein n=1 Tax=Oppiella nova TaxID=334625 RepID=A0A7R9MPU7_9ACAR|nr:unnamed protein product [Oppiella nova]CAG2181372.1 unnamed protein product [Oppiella nova]